MPHVARKHICREYDIEDVKRIAIHNGMTPEHVWSVLLHRERTDNEDLAEALSDLSGKPRQLYLVARAPRIDAPPSGYEIRKEETSRQPAMTDGELLRLKRALELHRHLLTRKIEEVEHIIRSRQLLRSSCMLSEAVNEILPVAGDGRYLTDAKWVIIRKALRESGGNKSKAARIVGCSTRTVRAYVQRFGTEGGND